MRNTDSPIHPVAEQQQALNLFESGGNLRIDAYAGTGKTTTLALLARSKPSRALYLAFNRAIARQARERFPAHIRCATTHSIAFRGVRRTLRYPEWKLTETLTPNRILDAFALPETVSFHSGLILERRSYASILRSGLLQFLQSSDEAPSPSHIMRSGILETLSPEQFASFAVQAAGHLGYLWETMLDRERGLPLGHDGYLKLWALSSPQAKVDYILVDEAQDLNPVLLGVLGSSESQIVYVGDPYQQIYEWRGAVNAMEQARTKHRCLLSKSFRFGAEIAAAATIVLRTLGAKAPLRGNAEIPSQIGRVRPDAILSRSNAGLIANVIRCVRRGIRCHVLGGTKDLERLLTDVQRIKAGHPAQSSELLGFPNWKEVLSFSAQAEGEALRPLVALVQEHGEAKMLQALSACQAEEADARVVCSTAHKAKGREWRYVHLDADFEAGFQRAARLDSGQRAKAIASEARLLYVAMTRAKLGVRLPPEVGKRFGIRSTTDQLLG